MPQRFSAARALSLAVTILGLSALACSFSFGLGNEASKTATIAPLPTLAPIATSAARSTVAPQPTLTKSAPVSAGGIIADVVMARESGPISLSPQDPTNTFAADQKIYHAVAILKDAPADTAVKVVWSGVDSGEDLGDYTLRAEGSTNLDFTYRPNSAGLSPGKYKVDVYLNDKLERTVNFQVVPKGTKLPATPTPRPVGQCPPPPRPDYRPPLIATKITMAKGTTGSQLDPENPTRVFDPNDAFYAVVHIEKAPADTKVKAQWFAEDVGSAEECNTQIITKTELSTSGTRNASFSLRPRTKWPAGVYHVYIYVNDNLNIDVDFRVE